MSLCTTGLSAISELPITRDSRAIIGPILLSVAVAEALLSLGCSALFVDEGTLELVIETLLVALALFTAPSAASSSADPCANISDGAQGALVDRQSAEIITTVVPFRKVIRFVAFWERVAGTVDLLETMFTVIAGKVAV